MKKAELTGIEPEFEIHSYEITDWLIDLLKESEPECYEGNLIDNFLIINPQIQIGSEKFIAGCKKVTKSKLDLNAAASLYVTLITKYKYLIIAELPQNMYSSYHKLIFTNDYEMYKIYKSKFQKQD